MASRTFPKDTVLMDCNERRVGFLDEDGRSVEVCFPKKGGNPGTFVFCCCIAMAQKIAGRDGCPTPWKGADDALLLLLIKAFGWALTVGSAHTYWNDFRDGRNAANQRVRIRLNGKTIAKSDEGGLADQLFQYDGAFFLGPRRPDEHDQYVYWTIVFDGDMEPLEEYREFIAGQIAPSNRSQVTSVVDRCEASEQQHKLGAYRIERYKNNLIANIDADASAIALGNMAIADGDDKALLALWEAICDAQNDDVREAISNPCAFTVGRITKERRDTALEDTVFQVFDASIASDVELIIDRFAHTVGEVARDAWKDVTKQRAMVLLVRHTSHPHPIVRDKYTYTKNYFLDWLDLHREDRRGEGQQSMGELFRRAEELLR